MIFISRQNLNMYLSQYKYKEITEAKVYILHQIQPNDIKLLLLFFYYDNISLYIDKLYAVNIFDILSIIYPI